MQAALAVARFVRSSAAPHLLPTAMAAPLPAQAPSSHALPVAHATPVPAAVATVESTTDIKGDKV